MIKVKFSGLLRLDLKSSGIECEATTVEELLTKIADYYPISVADLRNSIIFVRGKNIVEQRLFKTKLHNGDEVLLMTPASGG
jgi:molybdopterin converting factor small subunit